jgi:hypothetical protein
MKSGKLLNSKSGSLIGSVISGKLYQLDESIFAVAKSKIRQRIENKKREMRSKIFEKANEKLKK